MSVVGDWLVSYDWQCTGTYAQIKIRFNSNYTVDVGGAIGAWGEVAGMVIMRFTDGPMAVFAANRVQHSMTGMSTVGNGFDGCWYAVRDTAIGPAPSSALAGSAASFLGPKG